MSKISILESSYFSTAENFMLPINEKYFFNSKVHVINLFFSQKKKNAEEHLNAIKKIYRNANHINIIVC